MPRFSAGVKTGTGTTLKPFMSVFPSATVAGYIREIGITNTTNTAFDVYLARITAGGTVGAGLTEACLTNPSATGGCQAFTTHTGGTPTFVDLGFRATIGAAAGSGNVWTFGDQGLVMPATAGTLNGIAIVLENGTGQVAQAYISWDE